MSGGFITNKNDANVTGIGTAFAVAKAIRLLADPLTDPASTHGALPAHPRAEQLDLVVTVSSGAPATAKVLLTWDAKGDNVAFGPSGTITFAAGLTTTAKRMATTSILTAPRRPSSGTSGELWLHLIVDAGTVDLVAADGDLARLHWTDTRDRV